MARFLEETERRVGHCQKEHANKDGRIVDNASEQSVSHVWEYFKNWSWKNFAVEQYELGPEERKEVVLGM